MRSGRLLHKIQLQKQAGVINEFQEETFDWVNQFDPRRAAIEPLNGKEYFNARGEESGVTTRIRLRYNAELAAVDATWRVIDERTGDIYEIVSPPIRPQNRGGELILMCDLNHGRRHG